MNIKLLAALSILMLGISCGTASPPPPTSHATSSSCVALKPASATPDARTYGLMVPLSSGCGVMVFSGETGPPGVGHGESTAWRYVGQGGWVQLASEPVAMFGPASFDSSLNRVVLVGALSNGQPTQNDLIYDPGTNRWRMAASPNRPSNVMGAEFAFSTKSDQALLFGGLDLTAGVLNNDTWIYDLRTDAWSRKTPAVSPPPRTFSAMTYDEKSDRFILFGGGGENSGLGDTWAYDMSADTWTNMKPTTSPPSRVYHAMAYEPVSNRIVLFGGVVEETADESTNSERPLGDTWAYDPNGNVWTQLSTSTAPSARGWHSMAYDAGSRKVILFGGGIKRGQPLGDTWLFDSTTNAWEHN
jgi:hypothetical protein